MHVLIQIRFGGVMNIGRTVRKAVQKFTDEVDASQERLLHDQIIEVCCVTTPLIIDLLFHVIVCCHICNHQLTHANR